MLRHDQSGFGLVELLIAMSVLNIAILATVAAFSSGMLALNRANKTATAAVLADVEMERLRAYRYCDIRLDTASADALYVGDPAYPAAPLTGAACAVDPQAPSLAVQPAAVGADGRTYRVDTYMTMEPVPGGRDVKLATIVVRDPSNAMKVLTRQSSTFDEATG